MNRTRIEKATFIVHSSKGQGQGVLVEGGFVFTAAHCVDFTLTGGMALGDHCLHHVETSDGSQLALSLLAVEPISDLAVLGPPDNQTFEDEYDEFERVYDQTPSLSLDVREHEVKMLFDIHIFTPKKTWLDGKAMLTQPGAKLIVVNTNEPIEGGTSGGPIVNEHGELVAVVSHSCSVAGGDTQPYLCRALPVWTLSQITGKSGPFH